MIKHIGRHGDKKIVILYRKVPDEDHMALVVYSDVLPRIYHDTIMQVLESDAGQSTTELNEVLFRNMMPDGKNCLQALHSNGYIKKVQTAQIIVTPTHNSSIRLDELNKLLDEMSKGEEAIKRLSEIDERKNKSSTNDTLTDSDLAQQRIKQAESMKADAHRLLAEAEKLLAEAAELDITKTKNDSVSKKKPTTKVKKAQPQST